MNKEIFIKKLEEVTGLESEKCIIVNNILENHFIIGKNNKEKIVADFKEKLNFNDEEADNLYNECAEIIAKSIIKRK